MYLSKDSTTRMGHKTTLFITTGTTTYCSFKRKPTSIIIVLLLLLVFLTPFSVATFLTHTPKTTSTTTTTTRADFHRPNSNNLILNPSPTINLSPLSSISTKNQHQQRLFFNKNHSNSWIRMKMTDDDGNNNKHVEGKESTETRNNNVIGQMRGGVIFLKTLDREKMVQFYVQRIGMSIWLEQPNITILSFGNMILGFHQPQQQPQQGQELQQQDQRTTTTTTTNSDLSGMYTFVYPSCEEVDNMYTKLNEIADDKPRINEKYQIYQFFATDPEGRTLEFQAFLHPLTIVSSDPSSS